MDSEKKIDESWKESVEAEKAKAARETSPSSQSSTTRKSTPADREAKHAPAVDNDPPTEQSTAEVNFISYITSLAYQAMVFLGEVPNPMNNRITKNFQQAKLLIDTLVLIRDKTKGNLIDQEEEAINTILYELQMKFVEVARQAPPGEEEADNDR